MPAHAKPIANGTRFGRLVVVGAVAERRGGQRYYQCLCDCGKLRAVRQAHLRAGEASACRSCANRSHGLSRTPEFMAWCNMRRRCTEPGAVGYAAYGGRGISVCKRWRDSFEAFLFDMGPRPSPAHSIDRIDVNGNYEPENCRWATRHVQQRNTRANRFIEFGGACLCLKDWAARKGIPRVTLSFRLRRGWSVARALTEPVHKEKRNSKCQTQ